MTKFYGRAWVRDGAVYTLHTDSLPITVDAFTGWSDQIIDFEIMGSYALAGDVLPHLSVYENQIASTQYNVLQTGLREGDQTGKDAEILEARSRMRLSFTQLLIGLVTEEWITQAEGTAWLINRTPPAPVTGLIAQLPADQQFAALARAVAPSEVLRLDPLVVSLGAVEGKTDAELDTFFTTYSHV